MFKNKAKTYSISFLICIIICIALAIIFGIVYFHDHAFGTWGDDSAGYIYLWGKMSQNKPLVYQEPLTVKALEYFGDEKLARWTTPTHHEIISPTGYIASKYPIGLSLVMGAFVKIFNNDEAIYYVLPLLATLNLILLFLIANLIFSRLKVKYSYFFSLLTAIILGLASLYYNYAISQPMREIPSMFFMLAGYYFLLLFVFKNKLNKTKFSFILLILAGLCLGYSLNIRETSLMISPAFIILLFYFWDKQKNKKENLKNILKPALISLVVLIIAFAPSVMNSYNISKYKEKFKKKDISSVAITSNFDHIRSFSLQNIFDNQGKFRPGKGALPHYWNIMSEISAWPCFIALVFLGLFFLYRKDKIIALSLLAWTLGVLTIFSLWVNPYSRYILPLFPAVAILGVYGLYSLLDKVVPYFFKNKKAQIVIKLIIILSIIAVYQPAIADIKTNFIETEEDGQDNLVFKAISQDDLNNLKDLASKIKSETSNNNSKPPLVIFSGDWQYGISETFEAHTGLQAIRMPLEQKKFVFDESQVADFFADSIINDYNIYIWTDKSTKMPTLYFLGDNFILNNKYWYNFSFTNEVIIYELTAKN